MERPEHGSRERRRPREPGTSRAARRDPPLGEQEDEDGRSGMERDVDQPEAGRCGAVRPCPQRVRQLQERPSEVQKASPERREGRDAPDDLRLVVEDESRAERRRERRGSDCGDEERGATRVPQASLLPSV
jgi:hypothetical protein